MSDPLPIDSTLLARLEKSPTRKVGAGTQSFLDSLFQRRVGPLKVHDNPLAAKAAHGQKAQAFAARGHIYLGKNAPAKGSQKEKELLAHELTHVDQFQKGKLKGFAGKTLGKDDPLEQEAERMERKARLVSSGPAPTGLKIGKLEITVDGAPADRRQQAFAQAALRGAREELSRYIGETEKNISTLKIKVPGRQGVTLQQATRAIVQQVARVVGRPPQRRPQGMVIARKEEGDGQALGTAEARRRAKAMWDAMYCWGTDERKLQELLDGPKNEVRSVVDLYNREFHKPGWISKKGGLYEDILAETSGGHLTALLGLLAKAGYTTPYKYRPSLSDGSGGYPRIGCKPDLAMLAPGTDVTFFIEWGPQGAILPMDLQYEWICYNDRSTRTKHGGAPVFWGPKSRSWRARWSFPGTHRVVCKYTVGSTTYLLERKQAVAPVSSLATPAQRIEAALALQSHSAITRLSDADYRAASVEQKAAMMLLLMKGYTDGGAEKALVRIVKAVKNPAEFAELRKKVMFHELYGELGFALTKQIWQGSPHVRSGAETLARKLFSSAESKLLAAHIGVAELQQHYNKEDKSDYEDVQRKLGKIKELQTIPMVFVPFALLQEMPLVLYGGPTPDGGWLIVDPIFKRRTYTGNSREAALKHYLGSAALPEGVLLYPGSGGGIQTRFYQSSNWKIADWLMTAVAAIGIVAAVVAALTPEPVVSKGLATWLGSASLAYFASRGVYKVAEKTSHGQSFTDREVLMDAIDAVASIFAIGSIASKAARARLIFGALGLTADAAQLGLMTEQLIKIANDPKLNDSERQKAMAQHLAVMMLSGALIFISNKDFADELKQTWKNRKVTVCHVDEAALAREVTKVRAHVDQLKLAQSLEIDNPTKLAAFLTANKDNGEAMLALYQRIGSWDKLRKLMKSLPADVLKSLDGGKAVAVARTDLVKGLYQETFDMMAKKHGVKLGNPKNEGDFLVGTGPSHADFKGVNSDLDVSLKLDADSARGMERWQQDELLLEAKKDLEARLRQHTPDSGVTLDTNVYLSPERIAVRGGASDTIKAAGLQNEDVMGLFAIRTGLGSNDALWDKMKADILKNAEKVGRKADMQKVLATVDSKWDDFQRLLKEHGEMGRMRIYEQKLEDFIKKHGKKLSEQTPEGDVLRNEYNRLKNDYSAAMRETYFTAGATGHIVLGKKELTPAEALQARQDHARYMFEYLNGEKSLEYKLQKVLKYEQRELVARSLGGGPAPDDAMLGVMKRMKGAVDEKAAFEIWTRYSYWKSKGVSGDALLSKIDNAPVPAADKDFAQTFAKKQAEAHLEATRKKLYEVATTVLGNGDPLKAVKSLDYNDPKALASFLSAHGANDKAMLALYFKVGDWNKMKKLMHTLPPDVLKALDGGKKVAEARTRLVKGLYQETFDMMAKKHGVKLGSPADEGAFLVGTGPSHPDFKGVNSDLDVSLKLDAQSAAGKDRWQQDELLLDAKKDLEARLRAHTPDSGVSLDTNVYLSPERIAVRDAADSSVKNANLNNEDVMGLFAIRTGLGDNSALWEKMKADILKNAKQVGRERNMQKLLKRVDDKWTEFQRLLKEKGEMGRMRVYEQRLEDFIKQHGKKLSEQTPQGDQLRNQYNKLKNDYSAAMRETYYTGGACGHIVLGKKELTAAEALNARQDHARYMYEYLNGSKSTEYKLQKVLKYEQRELIAESLGGGATPDVAMIGVMKKMKGAVDEMAAFEFWTRYTYWKSKGILGDDLVKKLDEAVPTGDAQLAKTMAQSSARLHLEKTRKKLYSIATTVLER